MVELRSFQIFLILMIPFTAVTQQRSFTVRLGDEVTLPCEDVKDLHDKCFSTTWIFSDSTNRPAVTLFEYGQVHREAAAKSDRLSVTKKCSLVIKKVTYEDAGRYICRQFDESGKLTANSEVHLYFNYTAVTQHYSRITVRVGDEATLPCEDVKDYQDKCFSITWTFIDSTNRLSVTLFEYGQIQREAETKSDRLSVTEKCSLVIKKVTDEDAGFYICRQFISGQTVTDSQVHLSVVNRDNGATPPTTTKQTTKATKATTTDSAAAETSLNAGDNRATPPPPLPSSPKTTKLPKTTTKRMTKATKVTTRPPPTTTPKLPTTTKTTTKATIAVTEKNLNAGLPAILISVGVVLAALLIIIVAVIRWKRAEGDNSQLDDNTDDPPDGVFYTSIRYKKKTKSKARVQGGDDTVTYSTLNTSSTSARASTDPRKLYASINKTRT